MSELSKDLAVDVSGLYGVQVACETIGHPPGRNGDDPGSPLSNTVIAGQGQEGEPPPVTELPIAPSPEDRIRNQKGVSKAIFDSVCTKQHSNTEAGMKSVH